AVVRLGRTVQQGATVRGGRWSRPHGTRIEGGLLLLPVVVRQARRWKGEGAGNRRSRMRARNRTQTLVVGRWRDPVAGTVHRLLRRVVVGTLRSFASSPTERLLLWKGRRCTTSLFHPRLITVIVDHGIGRKV